MKTIKVKILDATLEAALLNPKVIRKYDEGVKQRIPEIAVKALECESGADAIEMQCRAVMDFVDEIFGEGSSRKVFDDETDLLTCLDAWEELTELYDTQVNPLAREYMERVKEKIASRKSDDA